MTGATCPHCGAPIDTATIPPEVHGARMDDLRQMIHLLNEVMEDAENGRGYPWKQEGAA